MACILFSQVGEFLDSMPLTKISRENKTEDCDQIIHLLRLGYFENNQKTNGALGRALAPYTGDRKLLKPFLLFCWGNRPSVEALLRSYKQELNLPENTNLGIY